MKRSNICLSVGLIVAALGLAAAPVSAQGSRQEAVARYKQGRELIEQEKYEEALRDLTVSYDMLESPNTLLLMAHAERELGHEPKAAVLYEKVISSAEARVDEGEKRFEKTAADAQGWLDKLSAKLGKLTISVSGAIEGTTVTVDGKSVKTERTSDETLRVNGIWWTAGTVEVEAWGPDGAVRALSAEVPEGGPASVSLDLGEAPRDTKPGPSDEGLSLDTDDMEGKPVPTATWVTGGIGVAGVATFAIFGSMAKSKSSDLDACAPRCPESERDTADAGKRDQTIANIGIAVGGIGLAAAAGFYFFQSPPESEAGAVDVGVAPNGILLRGSFH